MYKWQLAITLWFCDPFTLSYSQLCSCTLTELSLSACLFIYSSEFHLIPVMLVIKLI